MKDIIKQNNDLIAEKMLSEKASDMTKFEFISQNILGHLVSSNPNKTIDELTDQAVELTKMLIKKIN